MSEIVVPNVNANFLDRLSNTSSRDEGWHFGAGDPEYWKFHDTLVKPGGKVLDIGIGLGRSSLYFALNGMSVTGYDTNPSNVEIVNGIGADIGPFMSGDMTAIHGDINEQDLPRDSFDTAILAYMHHSPSKETTFGMLDKAFGALRPGGAMWFRAIGKLSSDYEALRNLSRYEHEITVVSDDVIEHPCPCSGEYRVEPTVFLDPIEVFGYFAGKQARFVHTQTLPQTGKWNMMFGENFRQDHTPAQGGMISVLAVKQ